MTAEHPETAAARSLASGHATRVARDERRADGLRVVEGKVGERPVSLLLDADGRMLRGRCTCSHHYTGGLRRGPCRHLQALRAAATGTRSVATLDSWYQAHWGQG
jgi:hypothetical protein